MKDSDILVPFKIFIHKDVLNDPAMAEDLGSFFAIELVLPSSCSNTIILADESTLTDEESEFITKECYKFFVQHADLDYGDVEN